MTGEEIIKTTLAIFGTTGASVWDQEHGNYVITFHDSARVTFDLLDALSKTLETRNINFDFDRGFGGSDVTPPDGATVTIVIRGAKR